MQAPHSAKVGRSGRMVKVSCIRGGFKAANRKRRARKARKCKAKRRRPRRSVRRGGNFWDDANRYLFE